MLSAVVIFNQKNASESKPIASQRSMLHRVITHLISSFLCTGICVAHAHNHSCRVQRHSWHALRIFFISSTLFIITFPTQCHAVGYSYARFVGPVSGPEREILVRDEINGGSRVDYVGRPEYQFAYGVEDSETQVLQNRKETRNGDEVKGVYSVVDPDGTLRVVKYTADNLNGFQAEVITNGVTTIHGQNDDVFKDNGSANWHVETGNNVDDDSRHGGGHENDYEAHDQYDDNSEDYSRENDGGGAYYDSNSDDADSDSDDVEDEDDGDKIEDYNNEEAHSEEAYSDESADY